MALYYLIGINNITIINKIMEWAKLTKQNGEAKTEALKWMILGAMQLLSANQRNGVD